MTLLAESVLRVLSIGIGATMVMDLWLLLQKWIGVPTLNFALLGRWVGHITRGRWKHDGIAVSAAIPHEAALGWLAHYAIGLAFAALVLAINGLTWARVPTVLPALAVGLVTVAAPLLVMQPAMGAGIASSRTKTPLRNCLKSVVNHGVFGLGLYLAALVTAHVM